jgi:hypothetical protein
VFGMGDREEKVKLVKACGSSQKITWANAQGIHGCEIVRSDNSLRVQRGNGIRIAWSCSKHPTFNDGE